MRKSHVIPPQSSELGENTRVKDRQGEKQVVQGLPSLYRQGEKQVVQRHRSLIRQAGWMKSGSPRWGWLPEIAVLEALILAVFAWVFVEARAGGPSVGFFFWAALAAMLAPVAIRVASSGVSREERMALVVLLGLAFYLVKVMHSPAAFTFPDELTHLRNVRDVLVTGRLFQINPLQPATAFYPGLPAVTSLVASLSGLSLFSAGILVIGAARLIILLGLFLIYENISRSDRVAGLGVLLYMANPNFLYWTAQYSYESLALPVAVLVLFAVINRERSSAAKQRGVWTAVALLGILMVVITHHMTAYIFATILTGLVVFDLIRSRGKSWGPLDLALAATGASAVWLFFVANSTIPYLSGVFKDAINSFIQLITLQNTGREFFKSSTTGYVAPLWERLNGMASVILVALGLPFGVLVLWQRYRKNVFALLLAVIALMYLPVQLLRLTSGGWETANRSSEFLFIGIAFVLAIGIEKYWLERRFEWMRRIAYRQTAFAGLIIILFFGGLIAGWPPRGRLPRPYTVSAGEHVVEPPSVSVAKWMLAMLGPNNRIAASKADAKIIGGYDQDPASSSSATGGVRDMFFSDVLGFTGRNALRKRGIHYVVVNRRLVSWDHVIGFYFINPQYSPSWEVEYLDPKQVNKFDGLEKVNRILDSGDILVYDVGIYLHTPMEVQRAGIPYTAVDTAKALQVDQAGRLSDQAGDSKALPTSSPQPGMADLSQCDLLLPRVFVQYLPSSSGDLYRLVLGQLITTKDPGQLSCIQARGWKIGNSYWLPPHLETEKEPNP